ncbi:MAG TPA: alcohol dehydrogenase, partial [Cyanobacteria bacterium UBA9579]|nr:alcohol dehydrogenase [Cyanobacteria bacterium UBA9579]
YGGGAAGLLMALAALSRDAKPYILEINPDKLKKSKAFRRETGIEDVSNDMQFDVAINAASSIETLTDGISRVKKGGTFCIYSGFTGDSSVSSKLLNEIHYRQLTLIGAYGCKSNQMKEALDILDKYQSQVRLLIEEIINLEQVPEALERVLSGHVFKYVVEFNK